MKSTKKIIALILGGIILCMNIITSFARPVTEIPSTGSYSDLKEQYRRFVAENPDQIKEESTQMRSALNDATIEELRNDFNLIYQIANGEQEFSPIRKFSNDTDEAIIIYDKSTKSYLLTEYNADNDELKITINNDEFLLAMGSEDNVTLSSKGKTMNVLWNSEKVVGKNDMMVETRGSWVVDPADPTGGYSEYNTHAILDVLAIVSFVGDLYTYKVTSTLFHATLTFVTGISLVLGLATVTLYVKEWRYVKSDCVLYGRKVIKYWDNSSYSGNPSATEDFNYWLAPPAGGGCAAYPYP